MTVSKFTWLCLAALLSTPAHAQTDVRITIVKPFKTIPPDLGPRLGPAIYSDRPWLEQSWPGIKQVPSRDAQIMPPSEFDREYTGRLVLERTDEAGIKENCRRKSDTACAYRMTDQTCFVWMAHDDILKKYGFTYDVVFRHERAHCLGWRHGN